MSLAFENAHCLEKSFVSMADEIIQHVATIIAKWDRPPYKYKAHFVHIQASETWFFESALGLRFVSLADETTGTGKCRLQDR